MKKMLTIGFRLIRWTLTALGLASLLGFAVAAYDERSISGAVRRLYNSY